MLSAVIMTHQTGNDKPELTGSDESFPLSLVIVPLNARRKFLFLFIRLTDFSIGPFVIEYSHGDGTRIITHYDVIAIMSHTMTLSLL